MIISYKKKFRNILLVIISFSVCIIGYGQEIITDRPDQTESSSTIPINSFQIETGMLFEQVDACNFESNTWSLPTTLLRFGITKIIELRLANQFSSIYSKNEEQTYNFGFGDLEFGTKIQILRNENINTEIAFITHIVFPFGDKRISNEQLGSISKLSISHQIANNVSIGYNIGYNYFGQSNGIGTYSVAIGFGLGEKLGFYIEPYGEWINFETWASNLDGGFTYLLQPNIQLDISYGVGLNYHMHYASVGFSWIIATQ